MASSLTYYELADTLGMPVQATKDGKLFGKTERTVHFGNLPIDFELKLVSAYTYPEGGVFLAKCMGNLVVMVDIHRQDTHVRMLNLAKMPLPENLLEREKPASADAAKALLASAVTRTYKKTGKKNWELVKTAIPA